MYSSIPNTQWDSNFLTLSFRCFVSWTARKLTNALVINSVTDICIFRVNITVFKDFSRLFHTYDHFRDFSRPWKFLHKIPGLFILFQDLYEPCRQRRSIISSIRINITVCITHKSLSRGQSIISKVGELFSSLGPPVRSRGPIHFLGPCFNSGLSNYQW